VVTVKAARGHDAKTVACSSCGATREEQAKSCGHCGSDFTIHETDLHTVCPACQTRVSDRARYCHHCAAPLVVESVAGEATERGCPVCGPERKLASRRLGGLGLAVLECRVCAGLWIGVNTFHELLEGEARRGENSSPAHRPPPGPVGKAGYRKCVECAGLMTRRNFGRTSGVIVDICGQHGIWFDQDEMSHLLAWVRSGGLETARDEAALLTGSPDRVRKRAVAARTAAAAAKPRPGGHAGGFLPAEGDDNSADVSTALSLAIQVLRNALS
jgi:hypothetical protein